MRSHDQFSGLQDTRPPSFDAPESNPFIASVTTQPAQFDPFQQSVRNPGGYQELSQPFGSVSIGQEVFTANPDSHDGRPPISERLAGQMKRVLSAGAGALRSVMNSPFVEKNLDSAKTHGAEVGKASGIAAMDATLDRFGLSFNTESKHLAVESKRKLGRGAIRAFRNPWGEAALTAKAAGVAGYTEGKNQARDRAARAAASMTSQFVYDPFTQNRY